MIRLVGWLVGWLLICRVSEREVLTISGRFKAENESEKEKKKANSMCLN